MHESRHDFDVSWSAGSWTLNIYELEVGLEVGVHILPENGYTLFMNAYV